MNIIQDTVLDLRVIEIHKQFRSLGNSRKDAWDYIELYYNLMDIGIPTFDIIDSIWND